MAGEGKLQMTVLRALEPGACLTAEALSTATALARRPLVKAVGSLIHRGLLERAEIGCYRITAEGLAFRQSGRKIKCGPAKALTQLYRRPRKATLADYLWRGLRALDKATLPDLLQAACREGRNIESHAGRYLRALEQAGYLRRLPRRAAGTAPTSNGYLRWQLIRDSGPHAPQLRTRRGDLFDPNTGESFPLKAVRP